MATRAAGAAQANTEPSDAGVGELLRVPPGRLYPAHRTVVRMDALDWLATHRAPPGTSIITSLPDVSELPRLTFAQWRAWFISTAQRLIDWLPEDGVAIFFQTDIRQAGSWVDKSYLILRAAEIAGAPLIWHKIVCRRQPGDATYGRPSYAHMLCVARQPWPAPRCAAADVLPDAGFMPWSRAMGEHACRAACRFLQDETPTRLVVDPFCGQGSVLAVANAYGFAAVGVDP